MRLTPDRYDVGEGDYREKIGFDIDLINRVFDNLDNENCHDTPVPLMPCCQYRQYKKWSLKKGRRFDAESFFLNWLEDEIWRSNLDAKYDLKYLEEWERDSGEPPTREIYKVDNWFDQIRLSHIHKKTSEFIKQNFPTIDIDPDPKRIKFKVWRLNKSGITQKLIGEVAEEQRRLSPKNPAKSARIKQTWGNIALAREVARIIKNIPEKEIDRRTLMRKHMRKWNLTKPDLESIHCWMGSLGIRGRREGYRKKTVVYYTAR